MWRRCRHAKAFGIPEIPRLRTGSLFQGRNGDGAGLAMLLAGERVESAQVIPRVIPHCLRCGVRLLEGEVPPCCADCEMGSY